MFSVRYQLYLSFYTLKAFNLTQGTGWTNSCPKYCWLGFSKNPNMLSALHLYLDEEWLHPIFCLIHPLNSVQPQPLLEMRVMMMMIASVSLSSVQCCNILTSKARMAYNNNQLKPDHRRWHEMHQPFEIHLSPSLKTTSINIRVFKCNIDSFFAPETYNTNALMMKSMNS